MTRVWLGQFSASDGYVIAAMVRSGVPVSGSRTSPPVLLLVVILGNTARIDREEGLDEFQETADDGQDGEIGRASCRERV